MKEDKSDYSASATNISPALQDTVRFPTPVVSEHPLLRQALPCVSQTSVGWRRNRSK
jgi:hypothetical protein